MVNAAQQGLTHERWRSQLSRPEKLLASTGASTHEDAVPFAKTIWLFREQLTRAGTIEELFWTMQTHARQTPASHALWPSANRLGVETLSQHFSALHQQLLPQSPRQL